MPSKPAQTLYSFFAHVYSFLYYFFYALPFTRKIGPPIIKDRLTCKVEREIESISHRRKMWLFYNVFAEYRWVWAARSLPSRNADSSVDQVDRTVGFRKYLHYHSTKEGQIARKPFGPTHDPERLQIRRFIKFYGIDASEFAIEDPKEYNSYNEFFTRALKEGARAPTGGEERIVSPADSKVVVYPNLVLSRKLWIKNRGFTVANLIGAGVLKDDADQIKFVEGSEDGDWTREAGTKWTEQRAKEVAKRFDGGAIGSFRLNLPDYHRFHAPFGGKVVSMLAIPGTDYEVDPYVVTSKHLGVLTGNERVVLRILCEPPSDPYSALSPSTPSTAVSESFEMLFIPIGAQDVGTVVIHPHVRPGYELKRGEEIGMFSFGGSNIIVVFTPGAVVWDGDLEAWSSGHGERWVEGRKPQADRMIGKPIECFVRAGDGIGTLAGMVKDKAV